MGIAAYKETMKATSDPKEIEHKVLQRITSRLEEYKDNKGFMDINNDMRDALWENQQLWNALLIDLVSPENKFPKELRAQMISLAHFVDKHTAEILKGKETPSLLIEINRSIMAGIKPVSSTSK